MSSASREVSTWASLVLGPDKLDVALFGRCWMGFDRRVGCVLTRVELDGRCILDALNEQQRRDLECKLACEYIAEPMRRHSSDAYSPDDDGPSPSGAA